ncbi:MAG: molecular chaperone DnaJ [Verrucomicrobia bacterium]|nr:molecular chaperone DnaJ [Verrucomicrobiota bacterium]
MAQRCYYEVMEVTRTVEFEEIKRSYRKLAVKHHPDKNPGDPTAEGRFREIAEAYDILGDSEKRAAYDRYGHAAFQGGAAGGGGHDPFDLFREMFGASGGGGGVFDHFFGGGAGGGNQDSRGSDLRYDLRVTLEEAFTGCEKEIELRKLDACDDCSGSGASKGAKVATCSLCRGRGQVVASRGFFQVAQPCPQCHGAGQTIDKPCKGCGGEGRAEKSSLIKLNIPAGIDEGSRLRSSGGGEAGVRGGGMGDLYVVIHVREHAIFTRDGADLHCRVPIAFVTAALGGEVEVPSLAGPVKMKVPAGTQGGSDFRIKHHGMPRLQSHAKGDLHVRLEVEVPTKLNAEQRQALEAFGELCGEENTPIHRSFTERLKDLFA